jgi:hypothetical protein
VERTDRLIVRRGEFGVVTVGDDRADADADTDDRDLGKRGRDPDKPTCQRTVPCVN